MGKKQAQFRFEDTLYEDINTIAKEEGITVTEVVRNALRLYLVLYKRTKGRKERLLVENTDGSQRAELVLPWL
jgi:metal-responsive CopG/Arc/MetJ family transcriptional regulator